MAYECIRSPLKIYLATGWRSNKRVSVEDMGNNGHPSPCMS